MLTTRRRNQHHTPFTLGRFDNRYTYAFHSTNIGNRVEVVFHIINYTDNLGNSVEKIIAYDSKNIYTIVSDDLGVDYRFEKVAIKNPLTDEEEYLDYISHDLPNNPVQLFENDIY